MKTILVLIASCVLIGVQSQDDCGRCNTCRSNSCSNYCGSSCRIAVPSCQSTECRSGSSSGQASNMTTSLNITNVLHNINHVNANVQVNSTNINNIDIKPAPVIRTETIEPMAPLVIPPRPYPVPVPYPVRVVQRVPYPVYQVTQAQPQVAPCTSGCQSAQYPSYPNPWSSCGYNCQG